MADQSKSTLLGISPTGYGIASVIAGCFAFAIVWLIFNQGPDGIFNTKLSSVAINLLLLFGVVCGLLGVGAGVIHKKWIGGMIGILGTAFKGDSSLTVSVLR